MAKRSKAEKYLGCKVMDLPEKLVAKAAAYAVEVNPANRPPEDKVTDALLRSIVALVGTDVELDHEDIPDIIADHLTLMTSKYWGSDGVDLSVSFMEQTTAEFRNKVLAHANSWDEFAKVKFSWSQSNGDVRISTGRGGYYSYLGPDIRMIPKNQQTMNLERFSVSTPESEYRRVVRHEFGHTLGFAHEHMRREIVSRLNVQKTLDYFLGFQGWDANTTQQQVLTPLQESSIRGTPNADDTSIMCYALPAEITTDGRAIPGGNDFTAADKEFAAKLYPLGTITPPEPGADLVVAFPDLKAGRYKLVLQL
jgi:hypothetical protein